MTSHSSPSTFFDCLATAARSIEDYHRRPSTQPSVNSIKRSNLCYIRKATQNIVSGEPDGAEKAIQSQKRGQTKNRNPHFPAKQTPSLASRGGRPQKRRHPGQSRRNSSGSQPPGTDRFSPRSLHRRSRRL